MEIEELRGLWSRVELPPVNPGKIIRSRSQLVVARINRSIALESLAVSLLYGSAGTFFLVEFESRYRIIGLFMLSTGGAYLFFLWLKRRLLNDIFQPTLPLLASLQQQIPRLKKYIRFYLWAGTIQFPVTICLLAIVFILKAPLPSATLAWMEKLASSVVWIFGIAMLLAILSVITYTLNKWYLNRVYGQHLRKLEQLIFEIEN